MALTKQIFDDIKAFVMESIAEVRYTCDEGTYRAEIQAVETESDIITIKVIIEKSNIHITDISLYGKNGHLWVSQPTDITIMSADAGVILKFDINIREGL